MEIPLCLQDAPYTESKGASPALRNFLSDGLFELTECLPAFDMVRLTVSAVGRIRHAEKTLPQKWGWGNGDT